MRRHRFLFSLLIAAGLAGLLYVLVSLFVPSPRRLIFGVDKFSGKIRRAEQRIVFLPPHQYYRLNFEKRGDAAAHDGVVVVQSQEGVPVKLNYRLRFGVDKDRMPDARRLVREGWSAWIRARVSEGVSAVSRQVPIEQLVSPLSAFSRQRDVLRATVADHLARSGLAVQSFEIERIEVDRESMLRYKRAELRRKARGAFGRVAILAVDGADWELIKELIDDGRMPNLASLIDNGVSGSVQPVQPTIAPLAWATLATGVRPDRHQVLDFVRRDGVPVDASDRRAPALWDIAPAFGRSALVVNWWTAWPPTSREAIVFDAPSLRGTAAVHPDAIAEIVQKAAIPASTIGVPQLSRFISMPAAEIQTALGANDPSHPVIQLRHILAKTWTDHRSAIALFEKHQPMLTMVGYDGSDAVNHLFGAWHPPLRQGVSWEEYRRYWPAVANYYSELDRLIGEWVKVLPTDTTLMIMSGYGMTWGIDRPRQRPDGGSALGEHRRNGFFVAYGNRIRPNRARRVLSPYDIAPTTLSLLGLPKSLEMPGEVISWALDGVEPIEAVKIANYGELVDIRPVTSAGAAPTQDHLAQLRIIGHIASADRDMTMAVEPEQGEAVASVPIGSETWGQYAYFNNLGVQLKRQGKQSEAVDAFEKAIELNPGRSTPYLNLTILLLERQQYTNAETVFFQAIERGVTHPESQILSLAAWYRERDLVSRAIGVLSRGKELFPESAEIAGNLGSALAQVRQYTAASAELERALALQPSSTLVLNNLGQISLRRQDYARALDYWNRSLVIDPAQPSIREGVEALRARV